MAGYTVEADTWRLHLEVPAGLEDAGVRRIRVMVSPQFQTVLPEQSPVDLRLAHPSTGQYVAQVAVGLRPVAEALLPSNADAAARVVADAVARMAALERCVAQTPAGAAAHTLVCGAASKPAEEYADVAAALRRAVTPAAPADVLTAPPHSFSARCVAVFSSGGLFTAALGSRRDVVAAGRIDGRRVEDASAVVRGTDGDVYVIASGALLRLRGRSVATLLPDAGEASALAFDPARRELWLIGGGTARVICTAAADLPVYTRGGEGAAGVLDSAHGSMLLTPDGVKAVGREEAPEHAEVAWQADVELPAGFRPRTACLRMAGSDVALFASLAAAGLGAPERVPTLGLRVSGDVADTLRVRLVSRPLRRMRLRLAGAVGADFRFHGVELHNA